MVIWDWLPSHSLTPLHTVIKLHLFIMRLFYDTWKGDSENLQFKEQILMGMEGIQLLFEFVVNYILSRATSHGAPSYGGVRTWVEGLKAWMIRSHRPNDHTTDPSDALLILTWFSIKAGRNNIITFVITKVFLGLCRPHKSVWGLKKARHHHNK